MASVSFKAVVYSGHRKKDGTYNVKIRVTHKRQTRKVPTNITATAEDLTRGKLKIKNEQIITQTDQLIRRWRTIVNNLGMVLDNLNVDEVIKHIQEKEKQGDTFRLDFFEYGEKVAAGKSEGTAGNYRVALNCLRRFVGSDPLDISLITGKFLQDFEAYIKTEPVLKYSRKTGVKSSDKLKAGGRAVSAYMECLRSIHNEAKREFNDEDIGIIRIPQSPFKKYKVKKAPPGEPRPLEDKYIQAIINLPDLDRKDGPPGAVTRRDLARDCFLLPFGLAGMNAADLLECEFQKIDKENDVIVYERKKTRTRRADRAKMKIRVEPCIWPLVEKYRDPYDERLFRFHYWYSSETAFNNAIQYGLEQIEEAIGAEHFTFYAARHSWASLGRGKAGVDKYTIHEGLNHKDPEMKVTDIYTERAWHLVWNANAEILKLFDWTSII